MSDWPVIFRTSSEIEARIVSGLLEANGIPVVSHLGVAPSVFPSATRRTERPPPFRSSRVRRRIRASDRIAPGGCAWRRRRSHQAGIRIAGTADRATAFATAAFSTRADPQSRAHEDASGGVFDNESLEFLGDAVLGFVVADMLFREFPQFQEGQKSKVKATLVSTAALARLADRIGLGDHVLLGRGEEKTGGRRKQALLADTCEALIAAIYLDGGIEEATRFVLRESADEIARVRSPEFLRDFKSALQELLQAQRSAASRVCAGGVDGAGPRQAISRRGAAGCGCSGRGRWPDEERRRAGSRPGRARSLRPHVVAEPSATSDSWSVDSR